METYDVIVAGAGASGAAAAVSAAKSGQSVLLVERYGFTGGTATAGLVHHWDPIGIIEATGAAREIYDRLKAKNALIDFDKTGVDMPYAFWEGGCGYDPEAFKAVCLEMLLEAGVRCLFHTQVTDAVVRNQTITEIEIFNKSGKSRLSAKVFVDATGDGDLFTCAGCRFQAGDAHGRFNSTTLSFTVGGVDTEAVYRYFDQNPDEFGNHPRMGKYLLHHRQSAILQGFYKLLTQARENSELIAAVPETGVGLLVQPRYGEFHVNATRSLTQDPLSGQELSDLEIAERGNVQNLFGVMKKYFPGFQNAFLMQTACQVGIRESRRLVGAYVYTQQDIIDGTEFADKILRCKWAHCDTHSPDTMEWEFKHVEGPYYLPYRSLYAAEVSNLLVAGRCASATSEAMASLRIIPIGALMGQAAGAAAAIAARETLPVQQISVRALQDSLREHGMKL